MIVFLLTCHAIQRHPNTLFALLVLAGFFISTEACSHWRESYLKEAVEEATQEDVLAKLGEPWRKKNSLLNSESTWIYRYTLTKGELDPMGVGTLSKSVTQAANTAASMIGKGASDLALDKPQCFHYVLTFNSSKILREWIRESCTSKSL